MLRLMLFILSSCFGLFVSATDGVENGWLVKAKFCRPFVSEIEGNLTKIEVGYGMKYHDYSVTNTGINSYSPYLNVSLGASLPIYYATLKRGWSIAFSIPISFHLWLSMGEPSFPVINTDYRFGLGETKLLHQLSNTRFIRNYSLYFVPFQHESTHIGDELTNHRKTQGNPITRVNVSYEYSELAITLNDPVGFRSSMHSLRLGAIVRFPTNKRWYRIWPNEGDSAINRVSTISSELYLQYQWQRSKGWLASRNALNVLSVELRRRAQYGYPEAYRDTALGTWVFSPTQHDKQSLNFNFYWGWQFYAKNMQTLSGLGFYLHAYCGIVPYGQFRNIADYSYLGFSIVLSH